MTITYVTGDLIRSDEQHIAHGCNTVGVMGAGIARVIAERYPRIRTEYQHECVQKRFFVGSALPVQELEKKPFPTFWNLGTQEQPGPDATLWGILLSFGNMFERMKRQGVTRVAIPRIGCGIGGLEWADVERTIKDVQMYVGKGAPEVVVYTQQSQVNKW